MSLARHGVVPDTSNVLLENITLLYQIHNKYNDPCYTNSIMVERKRLFLPPQDSGPNLIDETFRKLLKEDRFVCFVCEHVLTSGESAKQAY